ncbi:MAG: phosphate ABC transporter substrate-binding protein PstS [Acidimicrobiales bacterium]
MPSTTNSIASTPGRARRPRGNSLRIAGVVAAAGLIAAACGSSTPSASKKSSNTHAEASGSSKNTTTTTSGAGTTTTTAAGGATTTTTTTGSSGTKTTTTTAKAATSTPTTAAAASTPGGALSSNTTSTPSATLTGIGASSIEPFYGKVLYEYNQLNHGVTVNFTGSGSGPGVTAIEQDTANFGQSEVPMTAAQLAASKGPVLQVPVDLGGVAISYHVSGVSGLKLNGPVLAQIYLRQITNWNDPAIAALNPGVNLPNENIVPVFRSDTSGPGYDLDQYLIDTSPAWTTAIATSSPSTTWPTAGRATGDSGEDLNAGVASYIQETEGAIGYVEYSYALEANFSNAALLNKSGSYVTPSVSSIAAAGATATALSSTNFNIIYSTGGSTYALANFSWALIYQKQPTTNIGIVLGKLFQWVTTSGQSYSSGLGYAPLPATAVSLANSTLLGLQTSSGSPIFSS